MNWSTGWFSHFVRLSDLLGPDGSGNTNVEGNSSCNMLPNQSLEISNTSSLFFFPYEKFGV